MFWNNSSQLLYPAPTGRGHLAMMRVWRRLSVCRLSDVCRVHREYSWCPQLLEARRAGRRRCNGWAAASGVQRARAYCVTMRTACLSFNCLLHLMHYYSNIYVYVSFCNSCRSLSMLCDTLLRFNCNILNHFTRATLSIVRSLLSCGVRCLLSVRHMPILCLNGQTYL